MKVVPFLVALAILPGVDALAASDNYSFTGCFVNLNFVDPAGGYISLYVATNRDNVPLSQRTTYLVASKQTCDETACVETVAYGYIPNAHFTCNLIHGALATTIAPGANLEIRATRVEIGTGATTELPPPSGPISASFYRSRASSQTELGTVTRGSGGVTVREVGFSTKSSALVSGSILGTPLPQKGEVGAATGHTITVSRTEGTP